MSFIHSLRFFDELRDSSRTIILSWKISSQFLDYRHCLEANLEVVLYKHDCSPTEILTTNMQLNTKTSDPERRYLAPLPMRHAIIHAFSCSSVSITIVPRCYTCCGDRSGRSVLLSLQSNLSGFSTIIWRCCLLEPRML